MSEIIKLRNDGYIQLLSFTCYFLEAGVQLMEFPKLDKFLGNTCLSAYIHPNHALVTVMDIGGVTVHSFQQFTFNMKQVFETDVVPTKSSEPQIFFIQRQQAAICPNFNIRICTG